MSWKNKEEITTSTSVRTLPLHSNSQLIILKSLCNQNH